MGWAPEPAKGAAKGAQSSIPSGQVARSCTDGGCECYLEIARNGASIAFRSLPPANRLDAINLWSPFCCFTSCSSFNALSVFDAAARFGPSRAFRALRSGAEWRGCRRFCRASFPRWGGPPDDPCSACGARPGGAWRSSRRRPSRWSFLLRAPRNGGLLFGGPLKAKTRGSLKKRQAQFDPLLSP